MKILMVSPSYYPIIGGTETVVHELAVNLNEIGVDTDIMTFNMNCKWNPIWREIKINNIFNIFKIPATNPFYKLGINPLYELLKINVITNLTFIKRFREYDIIHFHDDVDLSFPISSYFIKKPKILHCHTIPMTYNSYKKNIISRYLFKNVADYYLCCSCKISSFLLKLGLSKSRIKILPYGVNTKKFKPSKKKKSDNTILFVGRMDKRKGLHVLLKALNYLKGKVKLVIISPSGNLKYTENVKNKIKKINEKGKHIITYLGNIDQKTLIKCYQKATLFVCPSLEETLGCVNLEALSCETVVVASNTGSIPDIIHNYKNGILVPKNNPLKLADAIQYLLDNEKNRIKFGKKGRKIIINEYTQDIIVKKLVKIYKEILNESLK